MSRIISPGNLYSKISEFLFLFNHMHEFLHFYFFFLFFLYFFPGVYSWCLDELFLCRNPIKPDLLGFPGIYVFAYGLLNRVFKRFTSFDIRAWLY
jgi:hypothetical protein